MTDALHVPAGETGKVRLFALDMPPELVKALREPGAIDGALGVLQVDPAYVEIFPVSDLQGLGLAGYLHEGCGISEDQIVADRDRLDSLKGDVMLVLSRAFGGRAVTLHPGSDLDLVGMYSEPATDWSGTTIATDSASKRTGSAQSPRAARSRARRIGGSLFAVFMLLIAVIIYLVIR